MTLPVRIAACVALVGAFVFMGWDWLVYLARTHGCEPLVWPWGADETTAQTEHAKAFYQLRTVQLRVLGAWPETTTVRGRSFQVWWVPKCHVARARELLDSLSAAMGKEP